MKPECETCRSPIHYDLIVDDDLWKRISPKPADGFKGGGLLCPECILIRALLQARKEGMEEAASIANGEVYHGRYRTWPFWPEQNDGTRGNISNESEIVRHCDKIAAAIRAKAQEVEP